MIKANELKVEEIQEYYNIHEEGVIERINTNKSLKPQNNGNGYLKVTLTIKGRQYQRYIHRLVAEIYIGRKDYQNQVNHIDGNKSNNSVTNLEWVSNSENQIHAHLTGLKNNGNKLWNGKFSETDINLMKIYDELKMKRKDIAKIFKCSKSTISEILKGNRYKYI